MQFAPIFSKIAAVYIPTEKHSEYFQQLEVEFQTDPNQFLSPHDSNNAVVSFLPNPVPFTSSNSANQEPTEQPSPQSPKRKKTKFCSIDRQEIFQKITISIERNCQLDTIFADDLSQKTLSGTINDNMNMLWKYVRLDWKANNTSLNVKFVLGGILLIFVPAIQI